MLLVMIQPGQVLVVKFCGLAVYCSTGTNSFGTLVKFDIIPSVSKGMTGYDKVHVKSV